MKKTITGVKTILIMLLILILSTIIGYVALVLAYLIPVNEVSKAETYQYEEYMGWDPTLSNRYSRFESSFNSFKPDVLNDSTDKIILQKVYAQEEGNPLINALYMQGYGRYWQGYVSVLRPIFRLLNYWEFHLVNGFAQMLLAFSLCFLIQKRTGKLRYTFACFTSYLLLMPVAVALSLQYSPVFYMAILFSIGIFLLNDRLKSSHLIYYFMICGILTCYFDFLTYPLIAWAYPLCWYYVAHPEKNSTKERFQMLVSSTIGWIVGYVGMYFTKWGLLYIICGKEMFDSCSVFHAFDYVGKIAEDLYVDKETYCRFDILFTNWRHYLFSGYICILLIWIIWGLYKLMKNQGKMKQNSLIWLFITLSSPAWFLVFTSHTMIHHAFTYRIYGASILAFILLICENSETDELQKWKISELLRQTVVFLAAFIVGIVVTQFAKENVKTIYGEEHYDVELKPGDIFSCEFSPTYSRIRQFAIMGQTVEGVDGNVIVTISDDDTKYTLTYDSDWFDNAVYQPVSVDWKFDAGKKYQISVVTTKEEGTTLFLSMPGAVIMSEYSEAYFNDVYWENMQPLCLIVYNTTVRSKLIRVYLALLVATYLFVIYCCISSIVKEKKTQNTTNQN